MPVETSRGYTVVLSIAQRAVLVMLAERGRTQTLDFTNFSLQVRDGLADLVIKGLITTTRLFGRNAAEYTLTELGAQVVDQIYASQKQSAQVEAHAKRVEENSK